MNTDKYKTPLSRGTGTSSRGGGPTPALGPSLRSTAIKRDTLAAELERDPQLSTSKRQHRTQAFTSTLSHASLERQLLAAHTAKAELETQLREKEVLVERLESDRRWLAEREKEEREERERERGEYEEAKRTSDAELRTLRSTLSSVREELADLQDSYTSLSHSSSHSSSAHQTTLTTLTHQNTLLSTQLAQLQSQYTSQSHQLTTLQAQYDALLQLTDDTARWKTEEGDMGVVREELKRQAEYLRTLERENARMKAELTVFRERKESMEVLKEEKRGLEAKIRMLEEIRTKAVKLEAEVEAARKEREEWASSNPPTSTSTQAQPVLGAGTPPPISQTQTLSSLRLTHARLLETHGSTKALLIQRQAELSSALALQAELEDRIKGLEEEGRVLRERVGRRDVRVAMAEREVGFLQALVASYNAEAAQISHTQTQPEAQQQDLEPLRQRIQQLETLLQEYKSLNSKLNSELDALVGKSLSGSVSGSGSGSGPGPGQEGGVKTLMEALDETKKENVSLKEHLEKATTSQQTHLSQIESLSQQLFELQGEIAGGRHVPPHTRILSLADNPESRWFDARKEAMEGLRRENEALLRRLREVGVGVGDQIQSQSARVVLDEQERGQGQDMGRGGGGGNELVPRESWEIVSKEKAELEELLKQKEKRLLRLQQVYQSKSAEFREAIASLLGLKLAFYPNGQVRVTSIYDLCASFVFQPAKSAPHSSSSSSSFSAQAQGQTQGATMQLVAQGEGGPQELPDLMRYWIENEQCIPGFLASVTLECYDKVKREGGLGGGGAQG